MVCFHVLTFPSFCTLQFVRASCLFDLFPCPYLFLPCALQLVSASHLLGLFHVLTYPTLCTLQRVSTPRSLGIFPCPDMPLLCSPGSECLSFARFPCPDLSPLRSPVGGCPLLAWFVSL